MRHSPTSQRQAQPGLNINRAAAAFTAVLLSGLISLSSGCAHSGLNSARENFYLGRFDRAEKNLAKIKDRERDNRVLLLMERGTIHQSNGSYKMSARDLVDAWEFADKLDYISLSRGTASMVINDRVQTFNGMPYERTLLHSMAAKSFFALEMWDDAAVEARNIIHRAERLDKFPDDAYSRYLAGLCMEMIFDYDAAGRQYRAADKLTSRLKVTDEGKIIPAELYNKEKIKRGGKEHELVCFIMMGRSPTEYDSSPENYILGPDPHAEIYCNGKRLGRSYSFSNTRRLLSKTKKQISKMKTAKTVARITLKEAAAQAVSNENEYLGEIVRLFLFAMEVPDEKRWETLPLHFQIARVTCPADMKSYEVKFKGYKGRVISRQTVSAPLSKRDRTFVSFCRDINQRTSAKQNRAEAKQK